MNARDFVYWLQGFMEIQDPSEISEEKLDIIKNHLRLTFYHDLEPEDDKPIKDPNTHLRSTRDSVRRIKC